MRVKKRDEGGTAFADLVYKPIVLIEMKKRGADLRRHYRQPIDERLKLALNRRLALLDIFHEITKMCAIVYAFLGDYCHGRHGAAV